MHTPTKRAARAPIPTILLQVDAILDRLKSGAQITEGLANKMFDLAKHSGWYATNTRRMHFNDAKSDRQRVESIASTIGTSPVLVSIELHEPTDVSRNSEQAGTDIFVNNPSSDGMTVGFKRTVEKGTSRSTSRTVGGTC